MPMSIHIYTHRNMYMKIAHTNCRLRNNAKRNKIQCMEESRILKTNQKHRYNILRHKLEYQRIYLRKRLHI